ncbi:Uncharacterised protein [Vibrio cholerae]|nr:Uncharacterised protein [Vibrio cholerae]
MQQCRTPKPNTIRIRDHQLPCNQIGIHSNTFAMTSGIRAFRVHNFTKSRHYAFQVSIIQR